MELQIFCSVFAIIFVGELPDKTALATLMMASKGRPLAVFSGVALAFVVQSLVAIAFGGVIGLFPEKWVHTIAGLLFIGFAAHMWHSHHKDKKEKEQPPKIAARAKFWQAAWKAFVVIFIAEWGDITQLATASLAARYHGHLLTVFAAATLALWSVTAIAVLIGKKVGLAAHVDALTKMGVVVFTAAGLWFLAEAWLFKS